MSQRSFADVVRDTRKSKDEEQWERYQRRKHHTVPVGQVPEAGPCCARCRHWLRPAKSDGFGDCQTMAIVMKGREKGHVFNTDDPYGASLDEAAGFEPLRTKAWFSCSQFADQTQALAEETWP